MQQHTPVALEALEIFRDLSPTGKTLLSQGVWRKSWEQATVVLHKGEPVAGAYIVLQGRLRIFALTPNGVESTLYVLGPGETCVLALNCLFHDLFYPAWVEAAPATTIVIIPGPLYRQLFAHEVAVQNVTIRALSLAVLRLMETLEQLHAYKLEQRLAHFLLLHASAQGAVTMTQQQMANHLGTTREVIARLLREFVTQQYIETRRGLTLLKNPAGLSALLTPMSSQIFLGFSSFWVLLLWNFFLPK